MAYRKKTLRTMSPTARKVARLIGELESVSRRLKNLIPDFQSLDFDSRALATSTQSIPSIEPNDHHYLVLKNEPYGTWRIEEFWPGGMVRTPFNTPDDAIARERVIAEEYGFLDTLYLANAEEIQS